MCIGSFLVHMSNRLDLEIEEEGGKLLGLHQSTQLGSYKDMRQKDLFKVFFYLLI